MTINLFVGDCKEYLADAATQFDSTACLIDHTNFNEYLSSTGDITAYTSMADLSKLKDTVSIFYKVLLRADNIFYRPPAVWSDDCDEFRIDTQQSYIEYFLQLVKQQKNNVDGLECPSTRSANYLQLRSSRVTENPQLWVAGCSITRGVGVEHHQRYPTLIASYFSNQFIDLSKPASSMEFAADQILRSDIKSEDYVLWGMTSEYRAPIWDRETQQCMAILPRDNVKTHRADSIVDETRLYKAVISFKQVANFCNKVGATLVAVPILCSENLRSLLYGHWGYYDLPWQSSPIDLGTDNHHPGPQQHQWYAEQLSKIFNKVL